MKIAFSLNFIAKLTVDIPDMKMLAAFGGEEAVIDRAANIVNVALKTALAQAMTPLRVMGMKVEIGSTKAEMKRES